MNDEPVQPRWQDSRLRIFVVGFNAGAAFAVIVFVVCYMLFGGK